MSTISIPAAFLSVSLELCSFAGTVLSQNTGVPRNFQYLERLCWSCIAYD